MPPFPTLGNTNAETSSNYPGINGLQVTGPYTATEDGSILSITGRIGADASTGNVTYRFVVYADNAGAPGALVVKSTATTVDANTAFAWVTLPADGSIVNGTSYWIGIHGGPQVGDARAQYKYNGASATKHIKFATSTYGASEPDPFPSPSSVDWEASFYLTYTTGTPPPVNTVPPSVTGTPRYGQTLTGHSDPVTDWAHTDSVAFQWQADTVDIGGATSSTFVLTAAQVGKAIRVKVTATGDGGDTDAFSAATANVASLYAADLDDGAAELCSAGLTGFFDTRPLDTGGFGLPAMVLLLRKGH